MVEAVEQQLLERAQAGDRVAFDQMQLRLQPELRRFIHHLVGSTDLADEILQDAFLALYLKLEGFKDAGFCVVQLFNPYLKRVEEKEWLDRLAAEAHARRRQA